MFGTRTKRPRNINAFRAAAILYGDWGTSKAYVLGLAFAVAGHSSFWLIAGVSILIALVGINYISICKCYPLGGGVYASVRKRSEVLSLVGAFFLIADYLVTAALSALSSFNYLGVPNPEKWAVIAICIIGGLNFLGPKHTGSLAFLIVVPTALVVILLGLLSIPHIPEAIARVEPIQTSSWATLVQFTGIIVALSGIEAVANITGVMKLDPEATLKEPSVYRTSTPAILWVMLEVSFFTAFLGLAMNALPGLVISGDTVNAPNYPNVRDSMLRYMGDVFASTWFGPTVGYTFGWIISIVFCLLLLSAVNTAIVALTSLLFIISRDHEMPSILEKLNPFGVPYWSLIIATVGSFVLILFVNDVAGLADLYAVGFVGAIATNLGSTSTDWSQKLKPWERYLMMGTFLIMALIEVILLIDKPHARRFAISILAGGLFLRSLVVERHHKRIDMRKKAVKPRVTIPPIEMPLQEGAILCAVSDVGKTLDFALQEGKKHRQPLFILFIRHQEIITDEDRNRTWLDDEDACRIFDYAKESSHETIIHFQYAVSDSIPGSIVEIATQLKISRIILGMSRESTFFQLLRGNLIQDVRKILPEDIDLVVIC